MENTTEISAWAEQYLLSHGYSIKSNMPENVQSTPWSHVIRFLTSEGYIYLKQTPPAISLEPEIIQFLYEQFHASVPVVIAKNKRLHCFLMKDAGTPLRQLFKHQFQPEILCQAIKIYSAIQYASVDHVNTLLELGLPDWRLKIFPELYQQFIQQENLLIDDGLTSAELIKLHDLCQKLASLCKELSHYRIPETLDHCDFHDNNILIEQNAHREKNTHSEKNTHRITITDLGETVITHPFFSLINCLRNAAFRYSLKESDISYLELQNACLENWLVYEDKSTLLEVFSLAKKIWPIYESFGQYRLLMSSDAAKYKLLNRRGRLVLGLKAFISLNTK